MQQTRIISREINAQPGGAVWSFCSAQTLACKIILEGMEEKTKIESYDSTGK